MWARTWHWCHATTPRPVEPTVILAIVLVGYFMIVLDTSIVFTGLSRLRTELNFTIAGLSWVQTAYALVFGGLLLLAARAGDLLGRRPLFILGLAIFSLASLSIGLAPTSEWLIASRAVQGIGSAILSPTSLALLTTTFTEGPARTRAVAAYGSTASLLPLHAHSRCHVTTIEDHGVTPMHPCGPYTTPVNAQCPQADAERLPRASLGGLTTQIRANRRS